MSAQHFLMEQTMRWFGPKDPVSLQDIRQAGCSGVVTALHHIPVGEIWTIEEIQKRKHLIEAAGLTWTVIESLPVHEDIKKQSGHYQKWVENYKVSLRNVAACGLKVVTYNFMPLLDWMRTEPNYLLPNGARTLRFEKSAFIAFDLFLLKRPDAEKDYSKEEIESARKKLETMTREQKQKLFKNALLALPGSDVPFTPEEVLSSLQTYKNITPARLKTHLHDFLRQVAPLAQELGLELAIHPDDPPYSILGLPRVVNTYQDVSELLQAVPIQANGLCFCTGSYGARADNDILKMMKDFGDRIHFFHFRNTKRDANGDFMEANHLEGDTDMIGVVRSALEIMKRRKKRIPMRPDHGHQMLDDLTKTTYPGYTAIGRLKGLAELRGVEAGLASIMND